MQLFCKSKTIWKINAYLSFKLRRWLWDTLSGQKGISSQPPCLRSSVSSPPLPSHPHLGPWPFPSSDGPSATLVSLLHFTPILQHSFGIPFPPRPLCKAAVNCPDIPLSLPCVETSSPLGTMGIITNEMDEGLSRGHGAEQPRCLGNS